MSLEKIWRDLSETSRLLKETLLALAHRGKHLEVLSNQSSSLEQATTEFQQRALGAAAVVDRRWHVATLRSLLFDVDYRRNALAALLFGSLFVLVVFLHWKTEQTSPDNR